MAVPATPGQGGVGAVGLLDPRVSALVLMLTVAVGQCSPQWP